MYIGIDIGGTTCRIAASSSLENPVRFMKEEFKLSHNFTSDFSLVMKIIKQLSPEPIQGIGIGITGNLNDEKTIVTKARNLPEWTNQSIISLLKKEYDCPVFMDNDVVAGALGEHYFGAEKSNDFFFINWGTGLGGAKVVANPKPDSTKLNWYNFFEIWEKYCGGNKIREKYGKPPEELSENEWTDIMNSFQKYLKEFIEKTSAKKIVFGGGISLKQSQRLKKIFPFFPLPFAISSLGEDAGLFGAFALIKNSL